MIIISALILFLTLETKSDAQQIQLPPQALHRIHFAMKGELIKNQVIVNCLAYQYCGNGSEVFALDKNFNETSTDLYFDLSAAEIKSLSSACPFWKFNLTDTFITDETNPNHLKSINLILDHQFSKNEMSLFFSDRNPVYINSFKKPANLDLILERVEKAIQEQKYEEAFHTVLKDFGIKLRGYSLLINGDNPSSCSTNHQNKVVNCGHPKNAFDTIRLMRHEAEHVLQVKHEFDCQSLGAHSLFAEQVNRERNAYINDMFNASLYLSDDSPSKDFNLKLATTSLSTLFNELTSKH